jgi:very-short-patch-repair endonuclease
MTEEQKAIFREKNCKAISDAAKNGSALEKFLFRELTGRGYNVSMHGKHTLMNENLQIDLFIDPQGVAIEVDGALHTCDIFNEPDKFRRRQERDELKNQLLLSEGYHLIRIQYTRDLTLAQKNELVNDLKRLVDRLADDDEAKLTIIKVN